MGCSAAQETQAVSNLAGIKTSQRETPRNGERSLEMKEGRKEGCRGQKKKNMKKK